ncbi:MAG: PDZ domain-containing protein [Bacteroidia bacterium]|nr:PDZ domain-containing protein [Bacteroidia bacterium]
MLNKLFILSVITLISMTLKAINYSVRFPNVKSHYVSVDIVFNANGRDYVDFKVPVWTPGSYKIREFSSAFENVSAENLKVSRLNKNTWRIFTNGKSQVNLSYDVYCFTVSVRQSYVDEYYAFLHGVSVFGYLEGYEDEKIELTIYPKDNWKNLEVSLPKLNKSNITFTCTDYDLLADSPIALGNFDTIGYESGNVPHKVVMIGEGNYDLSQIKEDFKKISDSQIKMMGGHPSEQYIHFIYNVAQGGGGLEHANSQTSMMSRWNYTNANKYRSFLGLIAHEYFHLWNIKRIRPMELGPFDYDKEVYSEMLWIAEGITSYYDDRTLLLTGKYSEDEYLKIISSQINRLENTPGKKVMSLAHSSLLAWVKAYLPNEESANKTISYYNKGLLAAVLLDLEIRKSSNHSLDDVMRMLYSDIYLREDRGFTQQEFVTICSELADKDMNDFFNDVIYSVKHLNYNIFNDFGIDLLIKNKNLNQSWSGVSSKLQEGKVIITKIISNSPGVESGLSVNDEIIAINGWRLSSKFEDYLSKFEIDERIVISYSRDEKMQTTKLRLLANPEIKYELIVKDKANKLLADWLE